MIFDYLAVFLFFFPQIYFILFHFECVLFFTDIYTAGIEDGEDEGDVPDCGRISRDAERSGDSFGKLCVDETYCGALKTCVT